MHLDEIASWAAFHKGGNNQMPALGATVTENLSLISEGTEEFGEFPLRVLHGREHDVVAQQVLPSSGLNLGHPCQGEQGWRNHWRFFSSRHL
jgi:hypothetical protein